MILGKRAVAAFYVPLERGEQHLEPLAKAAGVTDYRATTDVEGDPRFLGQFAGLFCEIELTRGEQHWLLEIEMFQQDVRALQGQYEGRPDIIPLDKDPALGLALTFRDACLALKPRVAFLSTNWGHDHEWVVGREQHILAKDSLHFYGTRYALTYLDWQMMGRIPYFWEPDPDREEMDVGAAMLIFRGRGKNRW